MMEKKDWAIILGTFFYSFLFYNQNAGLNFFLFSLLLIGLLGLLNPQVFKNKMWLLVAFLTALSGLFVLLYGSSLSIFGNVVCLLLLSAVSVNSKASVILNLFFSIYSVIGSIVFTIINISKKNNQSEKKEGPLKLITILIPLVLVLIFFFIYKNANPLFEKYTNFISGALVLFTLLGLYIVYGLISHERIKKLDAWESKHLYNINNEGSSKGEWDEKKAFIFLFVILNTMLIFINVLDINYLYLGAGMPVGVTHKEFVHDGVGMLIFSIVLGISIILYFFRGALDFEGQNKTLKLMVYAWLFQNVLMVFSTAIRNKMYIDDSLLTYKRIGVYYWLFIAGIGLITTGVKVWKTKSNWHLISNNSFIAYLILITSCGIDWDKNISDYNLNNTKSIASLDKRYLISLSETNIKQLYDIKNNSDFNIDSIYHYQYYSRSLTNESILDYKLYNYLKTSDNIDWRSFNYRKQRVRREILELSKSDKINSLNFSDIYIGTLKPLFQFNNIKKLVVYNCNTKVYEEIMHFKKLENLSVSSLKERDIFYLKKLKNLKTLFVSYTSKEIIEKLKNEIPETKIEGISIKQ